MLARNSEIKPGYMDRCATPPFIPDEMLRRDLIQTRWKFAVRSSSWMISVQDSSSLNFQAFVSQLLKFGVQSCAMIYQISNCSSKIHDVRNVAVQTRRAFVGFY